MKDATQELRDKLVELAIAWGGAFTIGDHRTANRCNSAITKIAKQFQKDRELGESILVPLFVHPNPAVRLFASIHALDQNIQVGEAETILTEIAEDPNIRLIPVMAQINLSNWIKKKVGK
jgi:hypothetical protein